MEFLNYACKFKIFRNAKDQIFVYKWSLPVDPQFTLICSNLLKQEAENFALYENALRHQGAGEYKDAEQLYKNILSSPLIVYNEISNIIHFIVYYFDHKLIC